MPCLRTDQSRPQDPREIAQPSSLALGHLAIGPPAPYLPSLREAGPKEVTPITKKASSEYRAKRVLVLVGIDPGLKGGVCVLSAGEGCLLSLFPMPLNHGKLDPHVLFDNLQSLLPHCDKRVYLEHVHSMPHDGHVGAFKFGRGFGYIEMAIVALGWGCELVSPHIWHRKMLSDEDRSLTPKQRSFSYARKQISEGVFYPSGRYKNPHDGLVDAYMIARYGYEKYKVDNAVCA